MLGLKGCFISCPDRSGAFISLEMVKKRLEWNFVSSKTIHYPDISGCTFRYKTLYPSQISFGFRQMPEFEKSLKSKRSISYPRVPVIPISYSSHFFRK